MSCPMGDDLVGEPSRWAERAQIWLQAKTLRLIHCAAPLEMSEKTGMLTPADTGRRREPWLALHIGFEKERKNLDAAALCREPTGEDVDTSARRRFLKFPICNNGLGNFRAEYQESFPMPLGITARLGVESARRSISLSLHRFYTKPASAPVFTGTADMH